MQIFPFTSYKKLAAWPFLTLLLLISLIASADHLAHADTFSAWGDNRSGQLGDGTTTTRLSQVPVTLAPRQRACLRCR